MSDETSIATLTEKKTLYYTQEQIMRILGIDKKFLSKGYEVVLFSVKNKPSMEVSKRPLIIALVKHEKLTQ